MSYAWIIDIDHNPDPGFAEGTNCNAKGLTGPRDAPDLLIDILEGNAPPQDIAAHAADCKTFTFNMYDDDGELYYSGRMITDEGDTEEACYGPLGDFGMPNAGAVSIRYLGHPDMDCG